MPKITILVGGNYTAELKERLKKYGISHGALAREMEISPSQLSRWFNTDMTPRVSNIQRIEAAIVAIRRQKAKERKAK